MAGGSGPRRVLITLGYAGWGAGQLEDELSRNGWLSVEADPVEAGVDHGRRLAEVDLLRQRAAGIRLLARHQELSPDPTPTEVTSGNGTGEPKQ